MDVRRLTQSRRLFARGAAIRQRDIVKGLDLLRRAAFETDGAAVGVGGLLAVDRLAHAKRVALVAVEQARVARIGHIADRLTGAQGAQHGVVKHLGFFNVVGTDHYVIEHAYLLCSRRGAGFLQ